MKKMRNRVVAIVDSNMMYAEYLANILENHGFSTIIVGSGLELISTLSIDRPSFLILDDMLCWVNPYELIFSIKRNPGLKDIKIVLMLHRKNELEVGSEFDDVIIVDKQSATDLLLERLDEEVKRDESA